MTDSEEIEPRNPVGVDVSGLRGVFDQFGREPRAQLGRQLAATVVPGPLFARIDLSTVLGVDRFRPVLGRQLAEFLGVQDVLRGLFAPVSKVMEGYWRDQWRDVFSTVDELVRSRYPENLRESVPRLGQLEVLLIDEGIPLMWVPGPRVVRALLDAPDAAARRRLIGQRWKGIAADCETVLESVDHPQLEEDRDFALQVVAALRAGHIAPAQALAANLLDSMMQKHFTKATRIELTKNDFKAKGVKFDLDAYRFNVALTFAPVWHAHAQFFRSKGDSIPRVFGRHPSAHAVSRAQYSRVNTVYGLMLVTSVVKFFDCEMP
ncbi:MULTISPECIES: hypothetical protein [unclassified Streptomyces]|uniref:hypothetical protein n=1 Tax=unclassified Streptomyces TaxID=2593676 RepID=UPI0035E31B71